MIQLRFCYTAGRKLSWSAQRAADGHRLDFATARFSTLPQLITRSAVAETGLFTGRYYDAFAPAPGELRDGKLIVAIHDLTDSNAPLCLGEGVLDCFNGATRQDYPIF